MSTIGKRQPATKAPAGAPSERSFTEDQRNALKRMISSMSTGLGMLRWEHKTGSVKWDCAEHHNERLDGDLAAAGNFGQWAIDYYAHCYRLVSDEPVSYMQKRG